jgi:hypothetical protein
MKVEETPLSFISIIPCFDCPHGMKAEALIKIYQICHKLANVIKNKRKRKKTLNA